MTTEMQLIANLPFDILIKANYVLPSEKRRKRNRLWKENYFSCI